MSSAMSSFFLLLSTPLLLFNVELPPFLVSWAIAFSYTYCCIEELAVFGSESRSALQVLEEEEEEEEGKKSVRIWKRPFKF